MGIYDREYYRDEPRAGLLSARSVVTNLIVINVVIFLLDVIGRSNGSFALSDWLALQPDLVHHPWRFWQLVTYGFVHDPNNIGHVLLNMFVLWMFGRELEEMLGRTEFLCMYLAAIVLAGLAWVIAGMLTPLGPLIGASGGVTAVMMVWVMNFPRRTILFMFFLPMPAWVLGVFYVLVDLNGAVQGSGQTAHIAHLAGAAFGFFYFRQKWNLSRLMPRRLSLASFRLRPRLRLHDPQKADQELSREVDRILDKINRQGEASLSSKERKTLEKASRRYQQRRD